MPKQTRCFRMFGFFCSVRNGGASRDRTDDPLLAKQVLSQLSYGPLTCLFRAWRRWLFTRRGHSPISKLPYSLTPA